MCEDVPPELVNEINEVGRVFANARMYEQYAGPYTFNQFEPGKQVSIDLVSEKIDDITIEPDQHIEGTLIDNKQGIITITDADYHPELIGWQVGLAVRTPIATPARIVVDATMRCAVIPNRDAAYYIPGDPRRKFRYHCPDYYDYFFARYARLQVGKVILFDTKLLE